MLQNAYFLAKIGADTAENERHFAEILRIYEHMLQRGMTSADGYLVADVLQEVRRRLLRAQLLLNFNNLTRGLLRAAPELEGLASARSGNLQRARSRLYRSEILQVNTRWSSSLE